MAYENATIIAASLQDDELRNAVNALVTTIDNQTKQMAASFDQSIQKVVTSLQKMTGALETTSQKIRKQAADAQMVVEGNKRMETSYKQLAEAQQIMVRGANPSNVRNADTLQIMAIQADLLREKLREAHSQFSSFVIMARDAGTTGDKGYYQFATSGVHAAEAEVKSIIQQLRALEDAMSQMRNVIAPQGHTIQNFVNSLMQTNPELALLNSQFKRGQSLLQQEAAEAQQVAKNTQQAASAASTFTQNTGISGEAIRKNAQWQDELNQKLIQAGIEARQTFRTMAAGLSESLSSNSNEPLRVTKEMMETMKSLSTAYYRMDDAQRESPIGIALKQDIDLANQLIQAVKAYNQEILNGGERNAQVDKIQDLIRSLTTEKHKLNLTNPEDVERLQRINQMLQRLGSAKDNLQAPSSSSYVELSKQLGALENQYKQLGKEARESLEGKQIAEKFQSISRALKEVSREMSRPTSLRAALDLPARTLDQITDKISALRAYKGGLDVFDTKDKAEIQQANKAIDDLTKTQNKFMTNGQKMVGLNNTLARSFNYLKNRLAYTVTVLGAFNFVKKLVDVRSQYELLERSIGILTDSAQKGSEIFRQLNSMALKSPFTTLELGAAAKQLVAFNIGAEDVVDTTRRLADMAAAVGIPMERLTYALGQVKAYGYLNSRDARIFLNAGIPIVSMLQEYYNAQRDVNEEMLTATQVRDMMTKRLISFSDVMAVVNKATDEGGRFFNFQEKAADTLKIRLANLTLAYNNMLNEMGKSQQGLIVGILKTATNLLRDWRQIERIVLSIASAFVVYKTYMLGAQAIKSLRTFITMLKQAETAQKALNIAMSGNAVGLALAAVTSIVSYLSLFNHKAKEAKERINEIGKAFAETRSGFYTIFEKGIKSESFNDQRSALKEMVDKAKEDLNLTIPITIEDVSSEDVKKKIRQAQRIIDEYISTARMIGESAVAGTAFDKAMKRYESSVTDLKDRVENNIKEIATRLDIYSYIPKDKIALFERGEKEGDIEYLDRVIKLMKDIGLIVVNNKNMLIRGGLADRAFDDQTITRFNGIIRSIEEYNRTSIEARKRTSQFLDDANEKMPIAGKSADELRYSFEQIAKNSDWGDYALGMVEKIAGKKYDVEFTPVITSKEEAENKLQDWQQKIQDWANENGIKIPTSLDFTSESIAALSMSDYIEKVGGEWKKANEDWSNKTRAAVNGVVGSDAVSAAKTLADTLKSIYTIAGGDPTSLNKDKGAKKDPLGDAMSKEIQYITDLQKLFKDYRSYGMDTQTALTEATNEFTKSLEKQHKELEKYGVKGVSGETLATMDMRGIRDMYQGWLDEAKVQKSAKAVESLEKAIKNLNNEINKEDYKKKTDSLNNTLSKLSQEYELGVELYANTDLSDAYADLLDIDPSTISNSIDDYADKVKDAINASFKDRNVGYSLETMNLTDDDLQWMKNEMTGVGKVLSDGDYELIKQWVEKLRKLRKDYAKDLVTQTKELQYELADTEGKIAIEMKKLDDLKDKRKKATDGSDEAELLDLKIQKQEQTIAKLGDEAVELFATYSNLFNSIVEHSDFVTRKLAKQWNDALLNAVRNADGSYSIIDPNSGQTTRVSEQKYGRLLNQSATQMRKVQNSFEKIKEALTKGDDKIADWVEGIKLITKEVATIGDGLRTASEIMEALGASEGAVEVMNDVASTMEGIGQIGQGVAELATNPISGAIHIIQGAWKAISTWLDNKNNEITRRIEEQERRVKDLQIAYEGLEYAAEKAMGAAEIEARRLAISNKKAQLAIEESNLALEKQREYKKDTDQKEQQDRIKEYESNIASLKREIEDMSESIVNDLLGEDMKSAAQSFVDAWVDAWKAGETTLDAMKEKMDEMVESLVNRAVTSALIEKPLNDLYEQIDTFTKREGRGGTGEYAITETEMRDIAEKAGTTAEEINRILGEYYGMLKQMGIMTDGVADKNLSALQQGIQGITEDTAGAIEAYLNGISGQIYLHSTLLTEIRDAVVSIEGGAGMAIQAQMLFQLQQSYMVQMSIQNLLNGWSSPDGLSVRVDMI